MGTNENCEDLLAQTWRLLGSLAAPELAPFLADWPQTTQRRPLLALYVWRSANLSQQARLDPPQVD